VCRGDEVMPPSDAELAESAEHAGAAYAAEWDPVENT
jgi:hypothetical protein